MWKYKEEKNIDAMFDFEVKETELPIYVKWTRYCLHWYIRKAVQNRFLFYFLSFISIICPPISTVLLNSNSLQEINQGTISLEYLFFTGLSIFTSLASSLLALFNMKDKWNLYRSAAEYLKMEYVEFIGDENVKTQEEIEKYMKRINLHMQQIHVKWQEVAFQASSKMGGRQNG